MSKSHVDRLVEAVLYEGYILYPYRPSVKSRHRWTFGGLLPEGYCRAASDGSAASNRTECLVQGTADTVIEVAVRFLRPTARVVGRFDPPLPTWREDEELPYRPVESLQVGGQIHQTWQEAEECSVVPDAAPLGRLEAESLTAAFSRPALRRREPLFGGGGGAVVGVLMREQEPIEGTVELSAVRVGGGLYRITLKVANRTPISDSAARSREAAVLQSMASTHAVLRGRGGGFVSLLDPPEAWRSAAAACRNVGVWPVLVGEKGASDTMLASPIILYDHPEIAPESPGDLFDGLEIDEILSLRILTLTDDEKRRAAAVDDRGRALMERTQSLADRQLLGLHGAMRPVVPSAPSAGPPPPDPQPSDTGMPPWDPFAERDRKTVECVHIGPAEVRAGGRVRLCPRKRADILDMALQGKAARVETIEQDYEGRIYLAVTMDDDPGRDLGALLQVAHRFFFSPDEVEPLP